MKELLNNKPLFVQVGEIIRKVNHGVSEKIYFENMYLVRFVLFGAYRNGCLFLQQAKSMTEVYNENLYVVSLINNFLFRIFGLPEMFDFRQDFSKFCDSRPYSKEELNLLSSVNDTGISAKISRLLILGYCEHKRFLKHEHGQTTKTLEKDETMASQALSEYLEKYCKTEVLTKN